MAVIGNLYPTVADVAKAMDPGGAIANVCEILEKQNPILQDIPWVEGNLPTGHRVTRRTALPTPTWRRYNEGIDPGKSTRTQVDETCGMLDGLSKIDVALANLGGNAPAFRADEDNAFVAGYGQEVATGLFYHNSKTDAEKIEGFTPRLNATAGNEAATQIIKADSAASGSDQTSIWIVGWSPQTVFGIFPKGSKAGLSYKDLGEQLVTDANSKQYVAYVTNWTWQLGVCVRDWRYLVRVCNIDTSTWTADCSAGADLVDSVLQGLDALQSTDGVRPVIYMNKKTKGMLRRQLAAKKTESLMEFVRDPSGATIQQFAGVPLRVCDALTITEDVVS